MTSAKADLNSHLDHFGDMRRHEGMDSEERGAGLERRQECGDKVDKEGGSVTPRGVIRALGTCDSCKDFQNS